MSVRLLSVAVEGEPDIILARQRTRSITSMLNYDLQDQTRVTTAVSEIVRNALEYGSGGRIEYWLTGEPAPQWLEIRISDTGPGIKDLEAILAGEHRSQSGLGIGIIGARRLMDRFSIDSEPGKGTSVVLAKELPHSARQLPNAKVQSIAHELAQQRGPDLLSEVRAQNRELLHQLDELRKRQEELQILNQELEHTNRGVLALYAELDERADHLRRADELKSRFLSNMTHEFRTPLNSMIALSRLLLSRLDGDLTAEQEKQVGYVLRAAETLKELVDDLLDIAKVEAGKTVVSPKEFTVHELFGALKGMLRPLLAGESVKLTFGEASDIPVLNTDESKVSQILRNFLSNAIKFTEKGEVRAWAEQDANDTVRFVVSDTGIGIAEEEIEHIWQEFRQVPHPLQTRFKGTGLGLPLSKRLAELLKGRVEVQSAPGQGSVFSLIIPRTFPRSEPANERVWQVDGDRIPVLVVEDNPADAFSYDRILSYSRYQALHARTIAEARDAIAHLNPAAVLLDLVLEQEETWEFLIFLKHRSTPTPVIIISSTQEERKARDLGADEYLHKPVEPTCLVRAIDRVTGNESITRVLLIDDEEISRYLVRQLLPKSSFKLTEATNAYEGLAKIQEDAPDVLLIDVAMEGLDGLTLLEQLPVSKGKAVPPAIIISSLIVSEKEQARLNRAACFLPKDQLSAEALIHAIRHSVDPREDAT
jgi:signal transduction histidine kinase/CheY-like chemotaxis protein